MKGERKLRLVTPAMDAGDAAVSDQEREAASALREVLDGSDGDGAAALATALRSAYAPCPPDEDALEAILARAMGDEGAATRAEREAASMLRDELAGVAPLSRASLFEQLRAAAAPASLAPEKNEALIEAALAKAPARGVRGQLRVLAGGARPARRAVPVTMVALSSLAALAAGVALFVGQVASPPRGAAAWVRARSAGELFDAATPFPRTGEESSRIDRIAAARAVDLRNNRFAAWGVR